MTTQRYRIRTIAGGGFALFVGASVVTFQIENAQSGASQYYTLIGADFGLGMGKSAGSGPSSWTDFQAPASLGGFAGYVIVKSAEAKAGVGYGGSTMNFITGGAAGVEIVGHGWTTGAGVGATATHGYMMLRN